MESSILRTFLYIIPSSVLSHSPSIIPSPRLYPNPSTLSIKFLAESFFLCSHFGKLFPKVYSPTPLHCWPNPVSPLSIAICFRTEEKLGSKRRHTEKEHCTESHSSGFLAGVIEFGCAFSNWN